MTRLYVLLFWIDGALYQLNQQDSVLFSHRPLTFSPKTSTAFGADNKVQADQQRATGLSMNGKAIL